ncbi:hypothetical protein D9M68_829790 [compost metagenome]
MDGVAVERFAQRLRAGERREERHLGGGGQRQGGQARGRADVAKQGEHVVGDELAGVGGAALGLVAVVQPLDLDRAAVDPAFGVDRVEVGLRAQMELQAQLHGRAGEGCGLPQDDAGVGQGGALRAGGCAPGSQGPRANQLAHLG